MLSAIKVGRQTRSIACLTTTVPSDVLLALREEGYTKLVVWLDNDNPSVNKKAREIEHTAGMLFPHVVYISDKRDPKHYSDEEIANAISS